MTPSQAEVTRAATVLQAALVATIDELRAENKHLKQRCRSLEFTSTHARRAIIATLTYLGKRKADELTAKLIKMLGPGLDEPGYKYGSAREP